MATDIQNVPGKPTTLLNWLVHNGFDTSQIDMGWIAWLQDNYFSQLDPAFQRQMLDTMYWKIKNNIPQTVDGVQTSPLGGQAPGQDPAQWMQQNFKGVFDSALGNLPVYATPGTDAAPPTGAQQLIQWYRQYTGRTPSIGEIAQWQDTGQSPQQIQAAIQGSQEARTYSSGAGAGIGPLGPQGARGPAQGTGYTPPSTGQTQGTQQTTQQQGGGGATSTVGPTGTGGPTSTVSGGGQSGQTFIDPVTGQPKTYAEFAAELSPVFGPTALATYGGSTPWAEQALQLQLTAAQARGANPTKNDWQKVSGLAGYHFSGSISGADVQKVLSMVDNWSKLTGYAYTPPESVIDQLAANPGIDQMQVNEALWKYIPPDLQAQHPGLQFGLSTTDYMKNANDLQRGYQESTGPNASLTQDQINKLLMDNGGQVSVQALTDFIQNDPATQAKAPWLQAGKNYHDWQLYQKDPTAVQQVSQRFGAQNLTSQNFLSNLLTPLQGTHASGGQVSVMQRGSQAQRFSLGSTAGQSEVR